MWTYPSLASKISSFPSTNLSITIICLLGIDHGHLYCCYHLLSRLESRHLVYLKGSLLLLDCYDSVDDWNWLPFESVDHHVTRNHLRLLMVPTSPKNIHKENVPSIVARFHTASEHNNNRTLRMKPNTQTFPKSKSRSNNDNKCKELF